MKNLKKVLALVVALTMVLGTVVFADFSDVTEDNAEYTAVSTLSSLNILNGYEDGTFKPDGDITRAEFCAVVCRALNLGAAAPTATIFSDVSADHWASGYIALASGSGIVNGMGDGTFAPDANVTYEQAVKMLVVALGFEPMAAQKGGYPTGYMVVANTYGLTKGISAAQDAAASRGIVAQLTFNALDIPMMQQTGFGTNTEYTIQDGKNGNDYVTLLTGLDVAKLEGVVVETAILGDCEIGEIVYRIDEANDDPDWEEWLDDSKDDKYTFTIGEGVNAEDYFGIASAIYVKEVSKNDYEIIAIMPGDDSEVLVLGLEDIDEDTTDDVIYYYETASSSKTSKLKLDEKVEIYYNYTKAGSTEGITDYVMDAKGKVITSVDMEITVIENNGDSYYDMIIIKEYTYATVDEVEADKERFTTKDGDTYSFDFDDEDVMNTIVDAEGNEIALDDFAEGDVVAIISDDNARKNFDWIEVINLGESVVTGTVTELDEDKAYIDGTEYIVIGDALKLGDEGAFYLTKTGKIFYFDLDASVSGNYAYILDTAINNAGFEDVWQVKLLTKEGSIITYDVRDKFTVNDEQFESDDAAADVLSGLKGKEFNEEVASRIITYKLDSSNYIKEINSVNADDFTDEEYNADAQVLDVELEDDVVVFNIDVNSAASAYKAGINFFVDESKYSGYTVKNDDDEYDCVVITEGGSRIDVAQDIAIVESVTTTKTENDEDAWKIRYYVSAEDEAKEIVAVDDPDITSVEWAAKGFGIEDMAKGTLFMFADDGNGTASAIGIIAKANNSTSETEDAYFVNEVATAAIVAADDDNSFTFGYIVDWSSKNGGKSLTLGDGSYLSVKSTANAYTYWNKSSSNSKIKIEVGSWDAGDVDKLTEDKGVEYATFFIARSYSKSVKDFITFSTRKVIKAAPTVASIAASVETLEVPADTEDIAAYIKENITVTATMSDGKTNAVADFEVTAEDGVATIAYAGKTTTVNYTVAASTASVDAADEIVEDEDIAVEVE